MQLRTDRSSRASSSAAMRYLSAAVAVALLCCACAAAGAVRRGRDCSGPGPALEELLRRNYSERSAGQWSCADHGTRYDSSLAFQFDSPGLELIRCIAAEEAVQDFADSDVYFVLLSGSSDSPSRYKCKFCDGKWYPVDRNPYVQRPLVECTVSDKLDLELEKHPADAGTRLEGVRCHSAWRKGCDRSYNWCHGKCCRSEALFYYPQLQQPIGSGKLLTTKKTGEREAALLQLLTGTTKTAAADC